MTYLLYRFAYEVVKDLNGRAWKRRREAVVATGLAFRDACAACRKDRTLHMLRERESEPEVAAAQESVA